MASVFNPQENRLMEYWNWTLKYRVQALCSSDQPWNDGIQELLPQHRHMPATAQGPSPATLLFRRPTHLTFEVAHTPDSHAIKSHTVSTFREVANPGEQLNTDSALPSQQSISRDNIEPAPVRHNWSRVRLLFQPGEQVLVKAGLVPKGTSPYRIEGHTLSSGCLGDTRSS